LKANDKTMFAFSMFIFVFFISVPILRYSFYTFNFLTDKFVIHFKLFQILPIWTYIAFRLVGHNIILSSKSEKMKIDHLHSVTDLLLSYDTLLTDLQLTSDL